LLYPPKGKSGSYLLCVFLQEEILIVKPEKHRLEKGFHVYCGSARGGFKQRINHHLKKEKRAWWHVDQITTSPKVIIIRIFWSELLTECDLARKLRDQGIFEPVKNFGSSDCRKKCYSHFFSMGDQKTAENKIKQIMKG